MAADYTLSSGSAGAVTFESLNPEIASVTADGGVTAAQKTLGTYYADEKGNYQEAAVYLQKAADRGDTDALSSLAYAGYSVIFAAA